MKKKNLKRHIKLFYKKEKKQKSNYLWEMCCKRNCIYVLMYLCAFVDEPAERKCTHKMEAK